MTAFTLVGLPLCHDSAFMDISKAYPSTIEAVSKQFNNCPSLLHLSLAPVSKPLTRLRHMQAKMETILAPAIREIRSKAALDASEASISGRTNIARDAEPFSVLCALAQRASKSTASPRKIGLQLMFLSLAALFVSAVSATQVVLQIVARPHLVREMRKEIDLHLCEGDKEIDISVSTHTSIYSPAHMVKWTLGFEPIQETEVLLSSIDSLAYS